MKREYIEEMFIQGRDEEARGAIIRELIQESSTDDKPGKAPTETAIIAEIGNYWASRRQFAYRTLQQQLDMQYHGTWEAHVLAVKESIVKPE